ncbi:hypothetical protein A7982_12595 [Minicystis rosea]|nr:hypothetical protein A7982_12595 [Minicystis rosea]
MSSCRVSSASVEEISTQGRKDAESQKGAGEWLLASRDLVSN